MGPTRAQDDIAPRYAVRTAAGIRPFAETTCPRAAAQARISTVAHRAKARNLTREPWAALHVNGPTFFSYAVLEGNAELSAVAAAPDDAVVDELVDLYREAAGEHDDWAAYRQAMVDEARLVIRFRPERAYGALGGLPAASGT